MTMNQNGTNQSHLDQGFGLEFVPFLKSYSICCGYKQNKHSPTFNIFLEKRKLDFKVSKYSPDRQ